MAYYNYKINFLRDFGGLFKEKYGRDPKVWSISELHTLWEKACDRYNIRELKRREYVREIVEKIPKNSRDEHVVYYQHDSSSILKYSIRWEERYKGYSIGHSTVTFSDDAVFGRQEKIDFILSNDLAFEMGDEYRRLATLEGKLQYKVFEIMWGLVDKKLTEIYKDNCNEDIYRISINGNKYYAKLKSDTRYDYGRLKFEFAGRINENTVEF